MSETARLPEDFGTRHHAAMGLAEQTDALVLVVSEERGTVSSFRDGTMTPLNSVEEIIAAIIDHRNREGFLAIERLGLLERRTFVPIVASLLLAAIFWTTLLTVNRQVVTKSLSLPLEYIQPAEGLLLVGEKTEEVRVQLAGPKSEIDSFVASQPMVKIDLSSMVEGQQTILITGENLRIPERLTFLDCKPAQIVVHLTGMVKKTVPVVAQLVGTLPANLKIKKVTVIPSEVQVLVTPPKRGDKPLTVSTTPVYLNSVEAESRIYSKIIAAPTIQPAVKPWQDVEVVIEVVENTK
jgi:YbbR domain-containing protein